MLLKILIRRNMQCKSVNYFRTRPHLKANALRNKNGEMKFETLNLEPITHNQPPITI